MIITIIKPIEWNIIENETVVATDGADKLVINIQPSEDDNIALKVGDIINLNIKKGNVSIQSDDIVLNDSNTETTNDKITKIKVVVDGLESDIEYTIAPIVKNKRNEQYEKNEFADRTTLNSFRTINNKLNLTSINFKNSLTNEIFEPNNNKIVVSFDQIPTKYLQNSSFKLLYKIKNLEEDTDPVYKTISVPFNQSQNNSYELTFDDNYLIKNREYVFYGIEVDGSAAHNKDALNQEPETINNSFVIPKTQNVGIKSFEQLAEYDGIKSKVKIVFDDPDNQLERGRRVSLITKFNGSTSNIPNELIEKEYTTSIDVDTNNEKYIELFLETLIGDYGNKIKSISIAQTLNRIEKDLIGIDVEGNNIKIYEDSNTGAGKYSYYLKLKMNGFGDNGSSNVIKTIDTTKTVVDDIKFKFNANNLLVNNNNFNSLWHNNQNIDFRIKFNANDSFGARYTEPFKFSYNVINNVYLPLNKTVANKNIYSDTLEYKYPELINGNVVWISVQNQFDFENSKFMRINIVESNETPRTIEANVEEFEAKWRNAPELDPNYNLEYLYKYAHGHKIDIGEFKILDISKNNKKLSFDQSRTIKLTLEGEATLDSRTFNYDKQFNTPNKLIDKKEIILNANDFTIIDVTNGDQGYELDTSATNIGGKKRLPNNTIQTQELNNDLKINFKNVLLNNQHQLLAGYKYKMTGVEFYIKETDASNSVTRSEKMFFSVSNKQKDDAISIVNNDVNRDASYFTSNILKVNNEALERWTISFSGRNDGNRSFLHVITGDSSSISYFPVVKNAGSDDKIRKDGNGSSFSGSGHANLVYTNGFKLKGHFAKLFEFLSTQVAKGENNYTVTKFDNNGNLTKVAGLSLREAIIAKLLTPIVTIIDNRNQEQRNKGILGNMHSASLEWKDPREQSGVAGYTPQWNNYSTLQSIRFGNIHSNISIRAIADENSSGIKKLNPMIGGLSENDFKNKFMVRTKNGYNNSADHINEGNKDRHKQQSPYYIKDVNEYNNDPINNKVKKYNYLEEMLNLILSNSSSFESETYSKDIAIYGGWKHGPA